MLARLRYDSPIVLTFALAAAAVTTLGVVTGGAFTLRFAALGPELTDVLSWWRLLTYPLGHADFGHLLGNMSLFLLLGPALERQHGQRLLGMMAFTAVVTGLVNMALFDTGLLGASGIVFMAIVLSSFANARAGTIPLSFVLVTLLFVVQEVVAAFRSDNISQLAHLLGGALGAVLGFSGAPSHDNRPAPPTGGRT